MDFKSLLSRKIAGIPAVWILAVIAGVGLYAALRMKSTESGPTELPTDAAAIDEEGDIDTDQPVFSATPVIMQPSGVNSVAATPMEDTNDLWARRAIEWLISPEGGTSLTVASQAIEKFLNGDALSTTEGVARDKAVKKYGLPPEGVPATSNVSTATGYRGPASRQGNPPTSHTVRGKSDDTPDELTRLYYGRTDRDAVLFLKAANTSVAWPARAGVRISIPKMLRPKYYKSTSAVNTVYEIARKNGQSVAEIQTLNPGMKFPVKAGTRVRVQ